jgi:hypothetical protein
MRKIVASAVERSFHVRDCVLVKLFRDPSTLLVFRFRTFPLDAGRQLFAMSAGPVGQWAGGRCYRPLKGRTLAVKLFNHSCCDDVWIDQREDAAHSWFGLSNEGEKTASEQAPKVAVF